MASASSESDDCAICMEILNPAVKDVRILPCCHSFHFSCLKRLITSSSDNPANYVNFECPLCRTEHEQIILSRLPRKRVPVVRDPVSSPVSMDTHSSFTPEGLEMLKEMQKDDDSEFTCATCWNGELLWLRNTPEFGLSASTFRDTAIFLFRNFQASATLQRYKVFFREKHIPPRWCIIEHSYHSQLDQMASTAHHLAITSPNSVSICLFPKVPNGNGNSDTQLERLELLYEIKHEALNGYISGITCIPLATIVSVNRDTKTVVCFAISLQPIIQWKCNKLSDPDRIAFNKKTDSLFVSTVYSGAVHILSKSGHLMKSIGIPGYDNWEILSISTSDRTNILMLVTTDCLRQYEIKYRGGESSC